MVGYDCGLSHVESSHYGNLCRAQEESCVLANSAICIRSSVGCDQASMRIKEYYAEQRTPRATLIVDTDVGPELFFYW